MAARAPVSAWRACSTVRDHIGLWHSAVSVRGCPLATKRRCERWLPLGILRTGTQPRRQPPRAGGWTSARPHSLPRLSMVVASAREVAPIRRGPRQPRAARRPGPRGRTGDDREEAHHQQARVRTDTDSDDRSAGERARETSTHRWVAGAASRRGRSARRRHRAGPAQPPVLWLISASSRSSCPGAFRGRSCMCRAPTTYPEGTRRATRPDNSSGRELVEQPDQRTCPRQD